MRYLDKWNHTKESVQELLNVEPDYVITDRDYIESFVEIEELSKEFLKKEGLWKKGKSFKYTDIWWEVSSRKPVIFTELSSDLLYTSFMLEPLVLDNYVLVGIGKVDSDLEELPVSLIEIEIYKRK